MRIFYDVSEVCIGLPITKRPSTDLKKTQTGVRIIEMETAIELTSTDSVDSSYQILDDQWDDLDVFKVYDAPSNISTYDSFFVQYRTAPVFSIVIFIGLNFVCFMCALICYVMIFVEAQSSGRATENTDKDRDKRMAVRMFTIVFTDFMCWIPISFVCILAQAGAFSVSPQAYAWIVGFILPINSAINPFLYTIGAFISDFRKEKKKKSK